MNLTISCMEIAQTAALLLSISALPTACLAPMQRHPGIPFDSLNRSFFMGHRPCWDTKRVHAPLSQAVRHENRSCRRAKGRRGWLVQHSAIKEIGPPHHGRRAVCGGDLIGDQLG